MFKFLFWISLIAVITWQGLQIFNIYNNNSKVQEAYDLVSRKMVGDSATAIRGRLPAIFQTMYFSDDDLPEEYYDNLQIKSEAGVVEISSYYHMTIWPLGMVENVNEEGEYFIEELSGLDVLRDKARVDFEFSPYAITPGSRQ